MQMDNISSNQLFEFTYNKELSYSANFTEWCYLNRKERETFGDTLLTPEQSQAVFDAQYGANNTGPGGRGV